MKQEGQAELFGEAEHSETGGALLPDLLFGIDTPGEAPFFAALFELSVNAYYSALYAAMSGLPIDREISRFIQKTAAAKSRALADKAASDRGDPDVLAVLNAAAKVQREIHRITGFLRFSPDTGGTYIARCAPDYFILPALAGHFTRRFGETPWVIIDEKRGIRLLKENGRKARLAPLQDDPSASSRPVPPSAETGDAWENLWRLYHRSTNNESRNNPGLQRQFMPARYRKYLNELS